MKKGVKTFFALLTVAGAMSTLTACSMPEATETKNKNEVTIDNEQTSVEMSRCISTELKKNLNKQLPYYIFDDIKLNRAYFENDGEEFLNFETTVNFLNNSRDFSAKFKIPATNISTESYNDLKILNRLSSEKITKDYGYKTLESIYHCLVDVNNAGNTQITLVELDNNDVDLDYVFALYNSYTDFQNLKKKYENLVLNDLFYADNETISSLDLSNISFEQDENGKKIVNFYGKIKYNGLIDYHDVRFGYYVENNPLLKTLAEQYENISLLANGGNIFEYSAYKTLTQIFDVIYNENDIIFDIYEFEGEKCSKFDITNTYFHKNEAIDYKKYTLEPNFLDLILGYQFDRNLFRSIEIKKFVTEKDDDYAKIGVSGTVKYAKDGSEHDFKLLFANSYKDINRRRKKVVLNNVNYKEISAIINKSALLEDYSKSELEEVMDYLMFLAYPSVTDYKFNFEDIQETRNVVFEAMNAYEKMHDAPYLVFDSIEIDGKRFNLGKDKDLVTEYMAKNAGDIMTLKK